MIFKFIILFLFLGVNGKVYFMEEFNDDNWESRWTSSQHSDGEWGKFILTTGKYFGDPNISKGIQTYQNAMHYGLSTKFESFSNKGKVFVLQFSVKHEQDIECGGGYIKVFDCSLSPEDLHGETPYLLMFGPDICGLNKKIHVIFNYKGKHLPIKKEIPWEVDEFTHLYTLIVRPNNTYSVKIDNVVVEEGKLEHDWDFLPPLKTKHSNVEKLADSSDNAKTEDPDDETRNGNQEEDVVDSDLSKIVDPFLYAYDEICGVGFDIWQVQSGTIFDNILITDDELEAEKHGNATWGTIKVKEEKMKEELDKITESIGNSDEEGNAFDEEEDDSEYEEEGEEEYDDELNEEEYETGSELNEEKYEVDSELNEEQYKQDSELNEEQYEVGSELNEEQYEVDSELNEKEGDSELNVEEYDDSELNEEEEEIGFHSEIVVEDEEKQTGGPFPKSRQNKVFLP